MIVPSPQAAWTVARKELLEHLRSKRLIITGSLYLLLLIIGLVVLANVREFREFVMGGSTVSLPLVLHGLHSNFLGYSFLSLLGIILMADTVCGEWKDRTFVILLTKPITRSMILTGKLIGGFLALMSVAVLGILVGLVGGIALGGVPTGAEWAHFVGGSLWLLFGLLPFLGLGTLMSALFRSPTTSFILGTLLKFVGFPVISTVGLLIAFLAGVGRGQLQASPVVRVFGMVDPDNMLHLASLIWGNNQPTSFADIIPDSLTSRLSWGAVAIGVHLLLYLTISYLIVTRRDYP